MCDKMSDDSLSKNIIIVCRYVNMQSESYKY